MNRGNKENRGPFPREMKTSSGNEVQADNVLTRGLVERGFSKVSTSRYFSGERQLEETRQMEIVENS